MIKFIGLLTFCCASFAAGTICWLFLRRFSAAARRLQPVAGEAAAVPFEDDALTHLVEQVSKPLNRLIPPSAAEVDKLRAQLMSAGYLSNRAVSMYRAIQLLAMLGLPVLTLVTGIFLKLSTGMTIVAVLVAFAIGYFAPRYTLAYLIKRRKAKLQAGLPDALDLMVVSMEAGLAINAAMSKVSEELADAHPEISEEFDIVNREIRFGRERAEALRNLADRTMVDDMRAFVTMLVQADRFGTSIGRAVRTYSESLRIKRRQRAEQAAQRAAVKLLLPLTCFLFPTLFIIILGPAAIRVMDAFTNNLK